MHFVFISFLYSLVSERDTIGGVQIRNGAVYVCMEVRVP